MQLRKTVCAWILAITALSATHVGASDYSISEFEINNISLPASFSSCSRDECDYEFSSILSANGYTHSSWIEKVMLPQNLYVCGRDYNGNAINISINDPSTEKDKEENIKYHRLMYDYNLYSSSSKTKEKALIKYRDSLVDAGINKRKIKRIKWFEKDEISPTSPYVLGIYETEEGVSVCEWCTIYDGNLFTFSIASPNEPTADDIASQRQIVSNISFDSDVDYSQAKQVYRQNQRVKLPERLDVKQKRSKLFVGSALSFISIVILSAIAITTTKIRKRTKSSRNSKNGRY